MKNDILYYRVGPLLYCPANNESIVESLLNEQFGKHYSLALCLEDTIKDNCLSKAESILVQSIQTIFELRQSHSFFIPQIFIRVRSPKQIADLLRRFGDAKELIYGFILPKFSLETADAFIEAVFDVNYNSNHNYYMMPIFESPTIINLQDRVSTLYSLKEKLDAAERFVLNIRVGGNDLCHMFGFRRHSNESIHSIRPIADIFSDIITVYGLDYVISGPVWEYYNGENWDSGLLNETKEDCLSGFIGKTVIHPRQIEIVNSVYKVSKEDFSDAKAILNWNATSDSLVAGSVSNKRMNEYKTHSKWALKVLFLAEAYGIK